MRSPNDSHTASVPGGSPIHALSLARESLAKLTFVPFREGVEAAFLYGEKGPGSAAAFLRYAPGAKIPRHRHRGHEHILILEGYQVDERGRYDVGTLVLNAPGTEHEVSSPEGCLVLVIWERPVEFVTPA